MILYATRSLPRRQAAYALLALAAREVWGLSPLPPLARGEHGKPYFPGLEDRCFNLSHSGSLALCARDGAPVGADLQLSRPWRPGLPDRVCAPEERAWLSARGDDPGAFALLWALKESRCKLTGRGITLPLSRVRVPLPREGEAELERDGLLFTLRTGPGWAAALCGASRPEGPIRWVELPAQGDFPPVFEKSR